MTCVFQKTNSCFWKSKKVDISWPTVKTFILCVTGRGEEVHNCVVFTNWGKMASCVQAVCQKLCKLWPQSRFNTSAAIFFPSVPQEVEVLSSVLTLLRREVAPACLATELMRMHLRSPNLTPTYGLDRENETSDFWFCFWLEHVCLIPGIFSYHLIRVCSKASKLCGKYYL